MDKSKPRPAKIVLQYYRYLLERESMAEVEKYKGGIRDFDAVRNIAMEK